jgi:hypothetical protein
MTTGKGKKRVRNLPVFYDELKKVHEIMLTPTAWKKLQDMARKQNTSISELIETWARNCDGS